MKLTHSIHAEQHRCKWLPRLLRLPKSTQSSLDHKVPVDDDEYDDEDEDDEENYVLWWWWVTVSCWWGKLYLMTGILKSISWLNREEEIPCVSWSYVSAEAKEMFLDQEVSVVEYGNIQTIFMAENITFMNYINGEDWSMRFIWSMKHKAYRKEAKERLLLRKMEDRIQEKTMRWIRNNVSPSNDWKYEGKTFIVCMMKCEKGECKKNVLHVM